MPFFAFLRLFMLLFLMMTSEKLINVQKKGREVKKSGLLSKSKNEPVPKVVVPAAPELVLVGLVGDPDTETLPAPTLLHVLQAVTVWFSFRP